MFCTQNRGRKCTSYSMQFISTSFWGRFCTYNNRHLTDKVHNVPQIRGMICTYKILIVTHFLCARNTLNKITLILCMFCYACRSMYILYLVSSFFLPDCMSSFRTHLGNGEDSHCIDIPINNMTLNDVMRFLSKYIPLQNVSRQPPVSLLQSCQSNCHDTK